MTTVDEEDPLLRGDQLAARARMALDLPLPHGLGLDLMDSDDGPRGVSFTVSELADNGVGGAHSAALTAAVEAAGYLAALPHLTHGEHAVTHSLSLQLVRAAPAGAVVEAHGELDRRTRRVAFVSVVARVGGATVARAQLVKSVVRMRR